MTTPTELKKKKKGDTTQLVDLDLITKYPIIPNQGRGRAEIHPRRQLGDRQASSLWDTHLVVSQTHSDVKVVSFLKGTPVRSVELPAMRRLCEPELKSGR